MMLPTLKKKSPFFLGNFVTKRSTLTKKHTEREICDGFNTTGQQYVGSEVGADLFQRELHSVVVHVRGDFDDGDKADDFHVLGRLENVKH